MRNSHSCFFAHTALQKKEEVMRQQKENIMRRSAVTLAVFVNKDVASIDYAALRVC